MFQEYHEYHESEIFNLTLNRKQGCHKPRKNPLHQIERFSNLSLCQQTLTSEHFLFFTLLMLRNSTLISEGEQLACTRSKCKKYMPRLSSGICIHFKNAWRVQPRYLVLFTWRWPALPSLWHEACTPRFPPTVTLRCLYIAMFVHLSPVWPTMFMKERVWGRVFNHKKGKLLLTDSHGNQLGLKSWIL